MPGKTAPLEEPTAACSRSAQALRLAILAVEDRATLAELRAAYVARVGLFEVCARCLVAAAVASERIVGLGAGTEPATPLTAGEALARVSVAERGFARAVAAIGRPLNDDRRRLAALARGQLAAARSLQPGGARRREGAGSARTAPPVVA